MVTRILLGCAALGVAAVAVVALNGQYSGAQSGQTGGTVTEGMREAPAVATVGQPAPNFTLASVAGEQHSLSDFQGNIVVLEWINHDCPFVKKFYSVGKMQELQERYREKGVIWLSINSGAPGKQGHFNAADGLALSKEKGSKATAVLLDTAGDVGRRYDAKTTPHMYVIDANGVLRYEGGIDNNRSANPAAINDPNTVNYVEAAVDALLEGREVAVKNAPPYGCDVKY